MAMQVNGNYEHSRTDYAESIPQTLQTSKA